MQAIRLQRKGDDSGAGGAEAVKEKSGHMYKGTNVLRQDIAGKEVCFVPGAAYEVDANNQIIADLIAQKLLVEGKYAEKLFA